ncbi:hypothetical protein CL621_01260 [archaeon]|nr:hypothetical protein [archaeon]|tara:strand:- start:827 stop:2251 length:1425 start_codon:yes stop_codon:yes gene_type:complete
MYNKKVVFVEPTGASSNIFTRYMNIPLLGPVYLATIAKKAGYDASVLNENILGRKVKREELEDVDILCLACITPTIDRGREIAREYRKIRKENNQESRVIVGGIHASMIPEDVLNDFDQIVMGEAENIIVDLLSGKIKDKIVRVERPQNLDVLPHPNFELVKEWKKIDITPVMTTRGCPYNCNFCSVTEMFGRCYRTRDPSDVVKEISRYKKGSVFFVDDHFTADPEKTNNLLNLMIDSGFNRPWSSQVRTEITKNTELVSKMRKAGCSTVCVGFESVNPKSLNEMKKGQTVEDIKRSMKVFHDNSMGVHGMFILGNDSDTKDTFEKTSEFCYKNEIDTVQYAILTPLPGTPLYTKLERENRILHKAWKFFDGLHPVFRPNNMTAYELIKGVIKCYKDFFSYSEGIKSMFNTSIISVKSLIKSLSTKVYLPSFHPPLMKFVGSKIIKDWLNNNRTYIKYLADPNKRKEFLQKII